MLWPRAGVKLRRMATQILVVDDDAELRDLLRDYLVRQGIEVSVLHDAGTLERRLERERPDLIVLDLMMPGVQAVLRRRRTIPSAAPEQREPFSFGRFRLDFQSRTLHQDETPLTLSGSEFALLKIFVNHPMRTLTRERLLELLHGPEYD